MQKINKNWNFCQKYWFSRKIIYLQKLFIKQQIIWNSKENWLKHRFILKMFWSVVFPPTLWKIEIFVQNWNCLSKIKKFVKTYFVEIFGQNRFYFSNFWLDTCSPFLFYFSFNSAKIFWHYSRTILIYNVERFNKFVTKSRWLLPKIFDTNVGRRTKNVWNSGLNHINDFAPKCLILAKHFCLSLWPKI